MKYIILADVNTTCEGQQKYLYKFFDLLVELLIVMK